MNGETGQFDAVMRPIRLAGVEIPNRVVRASHLTQYTSRGRITDRFVAYHAARARGGVGLTILESASVDQKISPAPLDASTDAVISGWSQVAEAVHAYGQRVFAQLYHGGNQVAPADGSAPWSASTVPGWTLGQPAAAMTPMMIEAAIESFAAAAGRAKAAGLDGVELHGAHGYLLAQFFSPLTNRRKDEYGGSPENRVRFAGRALNAVRARVGTEFPVGIRLSGNEWLPGGLTADDCIAIAQAIDAFGTVDFIDITAGLYQSMHKVVGSTWESHGYELPDSVRVARAVRTPCIVTGRIVDLAHANAIIARGDAAMVSMVRATIADPNLVRRTLRGEWPRPCIGCLQGCFGGLYTKDMGCTVNPLVGLESTANDEVEPAKQPRRVVVIGGGPAGLEAARIAACRGHAVRLLERSNTLGGQLRWARLAPGRGDIGLIVDWLDAEIRRLGVEVCTGVEISRRNLAELDDPDVVILATGPLQRAGVLQMGRPAHEIVASGDLPMLTSWDIYNGAAPPPGPVVVLDDVGHIEGMSVCEMLAESGHDVIAVSRFMELATQVLPPFVAWAGREQLARRRFKMHGRHFVRSTGAGRVTIGSLDGGPDVAINANALITVTFHEAASELRDALEGIGGEFHVIGDARTQRFLTIAIHEGHRVGMGI